jgi:hypothetical protein
MGAVGLDWQVAGFGDFNGDGISDMVLRNSGSGVFEVYGISHKAITSAAFLGTVGLDWQVAGFGDFDGDGTTDMVLRNSSTGAFEDYRISNNAITSASSLGAVGLDWQLGGFAVNPPTSMGESSGAAQLLQSMAGFGAGSAAAENWNAVSVGAETSRQPLLTMPQHA